MRTRKSSLFLVVSLICLSFHVQQCHQIMFYTLANAMGNAVGHAAQMTGAIGMSVVQGLLQNLVSTVGHGFATIQTMMFSLFSGFIMGNLALAGFILFLLAVVPAEEEKRSLGGPSLFTPRHLSYSHSLTDYRGIPLLANNSTVSKPVLHVRNKRDLLVNQTVNATVPTYILTVDSSSDNNFTLPDSILNLNVNDTDRVPRFLQRIIQSDPLNCLPLLLCGLGASRKPSERTEVLNDYAYVLKAFLRPDLDSPEDVSEEEDDFTKSSKKQNRLRSPIKFLNQFQGGKGGKKKDEVDKLIDDMRKEEEDKLEEEVLQQMAEDPSDLRFALEDMKVRGLKKTISKMPKDSKKKYISKLIGGDEESLEDDDEMGELIDDDGDPDIPKALMGRYERPDVPYNEDSMSEEGPYPVYYSTRDLARGKFPPPPKAPPVPRYGSGSIEEEELYKRNYALLKRNLERDMSNEYNGRPMMGPYPRRHPMGPNRRRGKNSRHGASDRAYLQKKRGEAEQADNVYDKSRVAAEVGAATRNNRQCRALFNECPVSTLARPVASAASETVDSQPFLNRAVNNIRRVILGGPSGGTSKTKRVNEIKEVIQQLHPPSNNGGSEVKVVLNIGPSAPPHMLTGQDLHRSGGMPAVMGANYGQQPPPPYPPEAIPQYQMATSQMPYNGMISTMTHPHSNMPMNPYMGGMMVPTSQIPPMAGMPLYSQPPAPSPTGFGSQLKYVVSKKPIQLTTSMPSKKTMSYHKPGASQKKAPTATTSSSLDLTLDSLEEILKTTISPLELEEEQTTDFSTGVTSPLNTFNDIVFSKEQDEPSVEDDLVLPTKYPMSKEKYAENLRETFQLFDRFKEAHNTPVKVVIPRTTVKPPAVSPTKKGAQATTRKPGSKTQNSGKKKEPSKSTPNKGDQGDLELDDKAGEDKNDSIGGIFKFFDNWKARRKAALLQKKANKAKKKAKKKAGKGKGKDSSEESSEEHHERPEALVAVPPPHLRQIVRWRSGTTLFKDGVYHLLFGKRETKPLPPVPHHHHGKKGSGGKKPIRHDTHYHDLSSDDLPQKDIKEKERPENDKSQFVEPSEDLEGPMYHRLRTEESFEADIPPPPPIQGKDSKKRHKSNIKTSKKKTPKETTSEGEGSKVPKKSKIIMSLPNPHTLRSPRPIPRPDSDSGSYEDDNEEDEEDNRSYLMHPQRRPMKPMPHSKPPSSDSTSVEASDETEDMTVGVVESAEPEMVFSPFSLVRNGDKVKLKSKGAITMDRIMNSGNGKRKLAQKEKSNIDLQKRTSSENVDTAIKKLGNPNVASKNGTSSSVASKPKRKIMRYKNG